MVLLVFGVAACASAVADVRDVRRIDHAFDVFEIVVESVENKHERAVGDEVARAAVAVFAEKVVESAAAFLFDEVGFLCLDFGVVYVHKTPISGTE